MKFLQVLTACFFTQVLSFPEFPDFVPNARNVRIQGVRVIGLGHPTATATSTSESEANPFGIDLLTAVEANPGASAQAIWSLVCDLDSDGDSVANKDHLCDPNCNNPGGNPPCPNGQVLTHPGGITEIGSGLGARKIHGWLMIFGWCVFAPYGILRAVFFKKRQSVAWFFEHKVALAVCMVLTLFAFIIMWLEFGLDPLTNGFENLGETANDAHVVVGIFVVLIVILQPISGMLRPDKPKKGEEKTLKRKIWEYQHQFTGRIGIILAFWAIYLGLPIVYEEEGEVFRIFLVVLLVVIGTFSIIYVLLYRDRATPAATSKTVMEQETGRELQLKSERISREKEEALPVAAAIGVADDEEQAVQEEEKDVNTSTDGKHKPEIAF